MRISIPPIVVDYVLIYTTILAMRPVGLFLPNGEPRRWGTGPEETPIPPWLLAAAITIRLSATTV